MPLIMNLHFFNIQRYPASFNRLRTCHPSSICSSGDLEPLTISSMYTGENYHLTEDDMVSIALGNVPSEFLRPTGT